MEVANEIFCGAWVLIIGFAFYMLPAWLSYARGMSDRWSVFFLNLFLGWTLLGWVGALCWAVSGSAKTSPHTTQMP
jgi:hypothetical protein